MIWFKVLMIKYLKRIYKGANQKIKKIIKLLFFLGTNFTKNVLNVCSNL